MIQKLLILLFVFLSCNNEISKNNTEENMSENNFTIEDFNNLKDFIFECTEQIPNSENMFESEKLGKQFHYEKFGQMEQIHITLPEMPENLYVYTIKKQNNKIIVFHSTSRIVTPEDEQIMYRDLRNLLNFIEANSLFFDNENNLELIIEGSFSKQNNCIYLGDKKSLDWIFYDKEHLYKLNYFPIQKLEFSETIILNEEFEINGIKIMKLIQTSILQQCPAIKYVFNSNNKTFVFEYPDCGVDEQFHQNAREYFSNFVKNNF